MYGNVYGEAYRVTDRALFGKALPRPRFLARSPAVPLAFPGNAPQRSEPSCIRVAELSDGKGESLVRIVQPSA